MAYIDKEKLKNALPQKVAYDRYGKGFNDCLDRVIEVIDEQPVVDGKCATCTHETDDSGYCTECYFGGKWQRKGR